MIKLDNTKVPDEIIKDKSVLLANCVDNNREYFTKDEVFEIINNVMGRVRDWISYLKETDSMVVSQVNEYLEQHPQGHMPKMDNSQIKAVLKAAKIDDQFEDKKTPIENPEFRVFATIGEIAEFKGIKFEIQD